MDLENLTGSEPSNPVVKIGTVWRHRNGNAYVVTKLVNAEGNDRYPPTIVYQNISNKAEYSRRADDWYRSMTHAPDLEAGMPNATFYYFKTSGKFYTSDRGVMPNIFGGPDGDAETNANAVWGNSERREAILRANQNHMPGLSTTGSSFRVVVITDEAVDFGYPLCLEPLDA